MSVILFVLLGLKGTWQSSTITEGMEDWRRQTCHQAPLIRNWHSQKHFLGFMKNFTKRNQHQGSSPEFSNNWSAQKKKKKKNLAFDMLSCCLISRTWNQWGDGAEGLVPLIHFVGNGDVGLIRLNVLEGHKLWITSRKLQGMDLSQVQVYQLFW